MISINPALLSTGNNSWSTPQWFFNRLNSVFGFTLDPCADDTNHKCERYYTVEDNGLTKNWGGKLFSVILRMVVGRRIILVKRIGLKSVGRNVKSIISQV